MVSLSRDKIHFEQFIIIMLLLTFQALLKNEQTSFSEPQANYKEGKIVLV